MLGMRERSREINRRRKRSEKRKKLRAKLGSASTEGEKRLIDSKIRKTYPRFTPEF
jgi:hypothetical protein